MKITAAAMEQVKIGSRDKMPYLYPNVVNADSVMYGYAVNAMPVQSEIPVNTASFLLLK